jgi:hypothetical protein
MNKFADTLAAFIVCSGLVISIMTYAAVIIGVVE